MQTDGASQGISCPSIAAPLEFLLDRLTRAFWGIDRIVRSGFVGLTSITKIPAIMRANKWFNGATLMDEWFAGPPTAMPAYTDPDTTTIKMDTWVLTFPRSRTVFDSMVRDKVWMSAAAKPVFASRLRTLGIGPNAALSRDISNKSTEDQHPLHVNLKAVPTVTTI